MLSLLNEHELEPRFDSLIDNPTNEAHVMQCFNGFWFRMARRLMLYLNKFCFLDMNKVNLIERKRELNEASKKSPEEPMDQVGVAVLRPQNQPYWSQVVRIFFVYASIKIMYNLYLQNDYDHRRDNLTKYLIRHGLTTSNIEVIGLVEAVNEARRRLKSVGAPYMQVGFILEIAYIYLLAAVQLSYLVTQVYFFMKPIEFGLLRYLLDPKREQMHLNGLIREQVNKFITSRRNYFHAAGLGRRLMKQNKASYLIQMGMIDPNFSLLQTGSPAAAAAAAAAATTTTTTKADAKQQAADWQSHVIHQLKTMMFAGQLQPTTRQPGWLRLVAMGVSLMVICQLVIFTVFIIICGLLLPWLGFFSNFRPELGPRDVWFGTELYLFVAIGVQSIAYYLAIMAMSLVDQIKLVTEITRQIYICIKKDNERQFHWHIMEHHSHSYHQQKHLRPPSNKTGSAVTRDSFPNYHTSTRRTRPESTNGADHSSQLYDVIEAGPSPRGERFLAIEQMRHNNPPADAGVAQAAAAGARMNSNFMRCFIHYKIFVAQLRPLQRSSALLITTTLILMILAPVAGRFYCVYLAESTRLLVALSSVMFMIFCDIYFTALCYFHSRCLELCRALSSLLAHAITLTHLVEHSWPMSSPTGRLTNRQVAYDRHLVCLLRKEFSHPETMTDQFAVKAFGIPVTYPKYVRIHFWLGLLILSIILVDSSLSRRVAGSSLGDSFGFF